jgi:hypothetical protein
VELSRLFLPLPKLYWLPVAISIDLMSVLP